MFAKRGQNIDLNEMPSVIENSECLFIYIYMLFVFYTKVKIPIICENLDLFGHGAEKVYPLL